MILAAFLSILVALIDTGIDSEHPHFANTNISTYAVSTQTEDAPDDCRELGHGTGVAGIVINHAPRADLLMVKALDCEIGRIYLAESIRYAADQGADIISIQFRSTTTITTVLDAVNYAMDKGIVVIASAGNDRSDRPVYPAAYPGVIAVGCDREEYPGTNYGLWVDEIGICNVRIAVTGSLLYGYSAGTSYAAPMIAGKIAKEMSGEKTVYIPVLKGEGGK